MADNDLIYQENTNDFIQEFVTDKLYKQIISELSGRKPTTKGSRRVTLTPQMLRDFLFYVSMGVEYKNAAEAVHMPEKTRQKYNTESITFRGVTSQAKDNVSLRARITVARAIMGVKPQYYKLIHPETKQPKYIELKEVPANTMVAQWWLERVDKIGDDGKGEAPQLGAPRNEKEAELLEQLLNKHHDYIQSKKRATSK